VAVLERVEEVVVIPLVILAFMLAIPLLLSLLN